MRHRRNYLFRFYIIRFKSFRYNLITFRLLGFDRKLFYFLYYTVNLIKVYNLTFF